MNKKTLLLLIGASLLIRIGFAALFPMTEDELNFWNYYYYFPDFSKFWAFFTLYDTQQPIFYLLWFPVFNANYPQLVLRLPSILAGAASIYYWLKLFPYKDPDNRIPWVLFLFAPFLSFYTFLFLPYALLVLFSIYSFYYFQEISLNQTKKNIIYFLIGCLLLTYTHYYGALLAVTLCFFLFLKQKNMKMKRNLIIAGAIIFGLLIFSTDFLNDFNAVHSYRERPTLFQVAGYLNLLIGGKFVAAILLIAAFLKRKTSIFKNTYFLMIIFVFTVAYLKSMIFSPSLEARYLLILTFPIFYLTRELQFKYAIPTLTATCLVSLYILKNAYGPAFVTDYSTIPKTSNKVGLLITPCPKYYFREDNYLCKNSFHEIAALTEGINEMIVQEVHLPFFNRLQPKNECTSLGQELYDCKW